MEKTLIITAATLLPLAGCSQITGSGDIDAQTADSLKKDSIAKHIIFQKDSLARVAAEIADSPKCDSNFVDLIIANFD
ncbi:MAG: hypothetical protein IKS00_08500 [Bacteroidales bacterium]|nr:hypothetical protein [Bacteroidales bacterium]